MTTTARRHALAPGAMLGLSADGVYGGFPAALRLWRVPGAGRDHLRRLVHLLHRGSTPADLDLLVPRHLRPLVADLVGHGRRDGWLSESDAASAASGPAEVLVHDTEATGWQGLGETAGLVGRRDVVLVVHGPEPVVAYWPRDAQACAECLGRWYLGTRRHPVETFEALLFEVVTGRARRAVPRAHVRRAVERLTAAGAGAPGCAGFSVVGEDGPQEPRWVRRHPSCRCPAPVLERAAPPTAARTAARTPRREGRELGELLVERAVIGGVLVDRLPDPDGGHYVVAQARVNSAYPRAVTAPLVAFGDAPDEQQATRRCLGEAVERFCTFHPERERLVRATPTELGDAAVPPAALPAFRAEQYARPDFPYRPPDDDAPLLWAAGVALDDGAPRWVPAEAVHPGCAVGRPLLPMSSTGTAAHPDRDTAVLSALLEVVERDCLATQFLLRTTPPRLAVDRDAETARRGRALTAAGFRLQLVDLTGETGIPCVLALADRPAGPAPFLLKGAAAAPDVGSAVQQALREVWRGFLYFGRTPGLVPTDPEAVDPSSVEYGMAYYQSAQALAGLDLLRGAPADVPGAAPPRGPRGADPLGGLHAGLDAGTVLRRLTDHLVSLGHPPVVVDCTLPVAEEAAVHVVRVVVPGLLPVAFGRRPWQLGGDRLDRLAAAVGSSGVRPDLAEVGGPPHFFT